MLELFQIIWFWLIALLIAGYFVLDGFDLGVGALYNFIAKDEKEKAILRRSIGPVWDGNEVWLITAGGALFAAFPFAYATSFSGFYLAIMLVLFSLIVRATALEFRSHKAAGSGKLWDILFFLGSGLPALLFGVAAGNVLQGVPLAANGDVIVTIPVIDLLTPFPLVCGILGLVLFLALGATWIAVKAPQGSDLQARAKKLQAPFQITALVVFVLATAAMILLVLGGLPDFSNPMMLIATVFALLFVVCMIVSLVLKKNDILAFLAQAAAVLFLPFLWAASQFPNLINATTGNPVTIFNGSSNEVALLWMTGITCIGVPLVLFYHFIIYRSFRGRIKDEDLTY
ncbi:MAG: cytochrome d ubiquinol oxidase subunit II [Coriobacteriales bacterium]|jgi:cytochrome d ubiquinol oxidase subunit II|nr:cytochrome d ubiquinol oxidase subunit II [Coriobacteriales bacterium]